MLYENTRIYKIIVLFLAAVFGIFLAFYIHNILSTGTVTVKTDSASNYVKIDRVIAQGNKNGLFSKQAQHKLSVRVKPGAYEISVYDEHGLNGAGQSIKVNVRQHINITINPVAMLSPEPVFGQQAGSVFADNSQLLFLDFKNLNVNSGSGDTELLQADSSGNLNTLFPGHVFNEIAWVNSQLGLAQDERNNLYVISNGQLSQLSLPFKTNASTKLSSAINSSGGIYVSDDKTVYAGSASGGFRKIYTADSDETIIGLSAAKNKVAVVMGEVEALESKRNGSTDNGAIAIVNDSGKSSKRSADALNASWSPSGNYLLVKESLGSAVFDVSLKQIKSIAINNSNNFTWLNDNSVLYSIDSQIWLYSLKTQQSEKITSLAAKEAIQGIYPSADGSFVYFTDNNGEKAQLYKVGLKGQPVDKSLSTLDAFLPGTIGVCAMNYINFTKPVITIRYPDSGTDPDLCIRSAKGELKTYAINPDKFTFVTIPIKIEY